MKRARRRFEPKPREKRRSAAQDRLLTDNERQVAEASKPAGMKH